MISFLNVIIRSVFLAFVHYCWYVENYLQYTVAINS